MEHAVPLGGLVGEDIYLIPERVQRLIGRLKCWIFCGKHLQLNAALQLCFTGFLLVGLREQLLC